MRGRCRGFFVAGVAARGSRYGIGIRGSYVPGTEARVQSTSDCEGHPAGNAGRSTWPNPTCRNMHSIDSVTPEAPFRGRFVHDLQSVTPGGDTPRSYGAGSGPVWHVRCNEEQGGTVRAQPLGANRPRRVVTNPSASETSGSTQHAGRGSGRHPRAKHGAATAPKSHDGAVISRKIGRVGSRTRRMPSQYPKSATPGRARRATRRQGRSRAG